MPKLPIVSGAEAVKARQRLGFFVDRQRGSPAVLKKITSHGERGCVPTMHRDCAWHLAQCLENGGSVARGIHGRFVNPPVLGPLRG